MMNKIKLTNCFETKGADSQNNNLNKSIEITSKAFQKSGTREPRPGTQDPLSGTRDPEP